MKLKILIPLLLLAIGVSNQTTEVDTVQIVSTNEIKENQNTKINNFDSDINSLIYEIKECQNEIFNESIRIRNNAIKERNLIKQEFEIKEVLDAKVTKTLNDLNTVKKCTLLKRLIYPEKCIKIDSIIRNNKQ